MPATTRRACPSAAKVTVRSRTSRSGAAIASVAGASAEAVTALLGAPVFRPVRAPIAMTGRRISLEPFRNDVRLGAEEQRDDRQLLGIDRLHLAPQDLPLCRIELGLDLLDQCVHARIGEGDIVGATPAVGFGRDIVGGERASRRFG